MKRYEWRILHGGDFYELSNYMNQLFEIGYEPASKIENRWRGAAEVTGLYTIVKRRISLWKWFKRVFYKYWR